MAHGPPKLTWTPPGLNTVDYARIGENLTKQVNDLLDAGKDVPIELLNKLDDFKNSPPQKQIISGKQALVQKARPAVQPVPQKPAPTPCPHPPREPVDGLLQAARDSVGYVDLPRPVPSPKAPPPSEAPHVKAMRAIATQSKVDAVDGKKTNGEPRKREENSYEAFVRKHLHVLGGDRKSLHKCIMLRRNMEFNKWQTRNFDFST